MAIIYVLSAEIRIWSFGAFKMLARILSKYLFRMDFKKLYCESDIYWVLHILLKIIKILLIIKPQLVSSAPNNLWLSY